MKVELKATLTGLPDPAPQTVELGPGAAQEIAFPLSVPMGISQLLWQVTATELGGDAIDRMKITQSVIEAVPVRTFRPRCCNWTSRSPWPRKFRPTRCPVAAASA